MQASKRQKMPMNMSQLSAQMQRCLDDCLECHQVCLETVMYCLSMGGMHANDAHIRMMLDCAEICQVSANTMMRGSQFSERLCGVCAEICLSCAEDCEKFGNDERMKTCAEACRRCAESCQMMTASMPS